MGLILLGAGLLIELINFSIMLRGHFHPGVVLLLSIIAFVLIVVGVWRDKKDMRRQRDKAIGWIE